MTLREKMEKALDGFYERGMVSDTMLLDALLPVVEAAVAAERERCARIAEEYSFKEPRLHSDVTWEETRKNAKFICHVTSQEIAAAIRAA